MPYYRIALIGGDGIGPEVVQEAARVLKAVEGGGLHFSFEEAEVGAALYRRTGEDLPRETVELCRQTDAILFGAAGLPDVRHADGTELVPQITLRMVLDLYAGVRPIKLFPGVPSPLALPEGATIDYVIFRENTEGLFASLGGGSKVGEDLAVDTLVSASCDAPSRRARGARSAAADPWARSRAWTRPMSSAPMPSSVRSSRRRRAPFPACAPTLRTSTP